MILMDLLDYFKIDADLPDYLLNHSFNDVFMRGELTKENDVFKIIAQTQKEVVHTMLIKPGDDYPVSIMSELPNGTLNGIKFGLTDDDLTYINKL